MVNVICWTRESVLGIRVTPDRLNVSTLVCELPKGPGVWARLFEWVLQVNWSRRSTSSASRGRRLNLELDYRAEDIDETVLANLVDLVHTVAEEQYPRIFRIVTAMTC